VREREESERERERERERSVLHLDGQTKVLVYLVKHGLTQRPTLYVLMDSFKIESSFLFPLQCQTRGQEKS
jgi:hypothetical protein